MSAPRSWLPRQGWSASVALAALAALAPAAALAKDLKVPSGKFPTIAAAAAAAKPGDRILVAPGAYNERVTITANRVRVVGTKAVWDGNNVDLPETCLTLDGNDCVVTGFTFRNGDGHITVNGDRAAIRDCVSRGARSSAIHLVNSTQTRIERCTVQSARVDLVFGFQSPGTVVTDCVLGRAGFRAVNLDQCDDATVRRCRVSQTRGEEGILVAGLRARVLRNRVANTSDNGILVTGNGARVERNVVSDTKAESIQVDGDLTKVRFNRVSGTLDDKAIRIGGSATSGIVVEGNTVTDATSIGIGITAGGAVLRNNTLRRCGAGGDASIDVNGDANTLDGNRIFDAGDSGIDVDGARNVVRDCTVTRSTDNGVIVVGDANAFQGLTVSGCDGEGIENHGTNTRLIDSTFSRNRLDITRSTDGTWVLPLTGVTFHRGGPNRIREITK